MPKSETPTYKAQSARDAAASGYGGPTYADYLERSAQEMHDKLLALGYTPEHAETMFTRSLSEALTGNDGD